MVVMKMPLNSKQKAHKEAYKAGYVMGLSYAPMFSVMPKNINKELLEEWVAGFAQGRLESEMEDYGPELAGDE
jgi:hypothetical protein